MSREYKNNKASNAGYEKCDECVPFESVEELWFWFIAAQQARNDGARYVAGVGNVRRPCGPVDVLKVLDSLYRKRRLLRSHFLVLCHYGKRFMAPDPRRIKEQRAHYIWREAFERMEPVLEKKGIVVRPHWVQQHGFSFLHEGERI